MKKIFVCLVLTLFVLSSLQLQVFPEARAKNDLNAKLISSETIVILEEDGTITKDVSEVIEILSKQGVNLYQALKIDYYSETEKVNLKEVYTIANGKKYEVGKDAIKDITNPTIALVASSLYVDLKQKQISMPRVDVGSKIVYSYEITSKPLTSGVFFDQFIFNSAPQGIELNNISYTLKAPRNTYVNLEWNNLDDPRVEEKEDIMTYTWEVESIENAKPELLMPNSWDAHSWIAFSSFRNWGEVGSWYSDLAAEYDIYQTDTEIENEVDNLISEDMSGFDKVMAIYRFVAEKVRYVGISSGLGRFKPHNATSVYNTLYGDCKDQATLLIAMLNHAGIKSYPALLGTTSFARFLDRIPTLIWTQHVIVAVPTREGYLYFDPSSYMPPYGDVAPYYENMGAIPFQDQNCDILISKPEETIISRTPILKAEDNLVRITQDIELKSDGTLEGNATFYCTGQKSEQMRMTFRLIEQLKEQEDSFLDPKTLLKSTIQILAPGAEIVDFQVLSDLDKPDKKFEFNVSYKAENYGKVVNGSMVMEIPLNKFKKASEGEFGGEIMKALKELQLKERKYPMMNIPTRSEDIIHLRVPPNSGLILPENKTIKTEIISFECNFEKLSDAELIIRSSQAVNATIMEPEEYSEFLNFSQDLYEFTPEIEARGVGKVSIIERVINLIKSLISRLLSPIRNIVPFLNRVI